MTELKILEWTQEYLKYKDMVQRKIQTIKKINDEELVCELKNGEQKHYICVNTLDDSILEKLKNKNVSCLNTKQNLNWVITNWNNLKKENTVFFFANPKKAMHWSVNPKVHDGVTDKATIKTGLKTLFDTIPEV